ncbi:hypothetical protein RKE30_22365 [Streptomyces sp. Li-HN-5-11]|uniref:hypothetical protein n=1 Tax=Streptomyces sp. Li-HN-5-11 TaxID=3075432 RepID=UPI0028A78525|nr:hypothetical protein [Streptomyces sp. Li-HN-5-11]WNM32930.1 hypothetical protein RKE30_22365 [Streptomyces sp. Li-HN-5-11]
MNLTRHPTRRGTAAALTLLTAAALGLTGASASNADSAAPPQTRQIASSVLGGDYKFTLTAVRSTTDAYAASVRLQVYTRTGTGAWKESDRATVGDVDGWFWYPLTGKGAVCQFSTSAGEPAPVDVSLLVTPSIGCSQPSHFVVEQGRIHAG